ncbi:hypothetical protein ACLB2K_073709 [Fragaria x ananassa]
MILKIQNDSDHWIVGEKFIKLEFENQFQQTFTSSSLRDWGDALRGVAPVITDEMNVDLGWPFTYDEVRDAAFQLGALKAPRPDGFPGLFYHKYWGIVNEIIRTTSSDFLAGKDNIMLAHEAFHYLRLKKDGENHELGLKLNMNKAYDRVEWDFLEATLRRFGFANGWVNLIMACVTTVSFSIVLNGCPGSSFCPSRGLRQRDPLSPYLFLLVSEVLSLRITKAVVERSLLGVRLACKCLSLSHLFFADDSLFFMKATLLNCSKISLIFKEYCSASGQLISLEKSSIYFTPNTSDQMKHLMSLLLGITCIDQPGVYLGLPTFWGRSKNGALAYIKEKVANKMDGWKEKVLTQAGKEVLIKSVALDIPSFPMSCFRFPNGICDDLNAALGNFWWGTNETGNNIHWKSW